MPSVEIHPFSDDFRVDAARLLAERHARERESEPLLPEIDDFEPHVPRGEGAVATRGDDVVGYVVGTVRAYGNAGERWAFVDLGGCAASDPDAVPDLFAALAERWHADGIRRFGVMVPTSERELADTWFRLAFGCQFMLAVRETEEAAPVHFGGTIRSGGPEDLPAVAEFDRILWRLQAGSPSFSGQSLAAEDFEAEWRDTWDDPEQFPHFVAELDGKVIGHALLYRRPSGDLRVPADNIDLAHAATLHHVRGSGAGLALTAHALNWAHGHGFRSTTMDWRSVNLLAARFWPKRGWRPTHYRLYRAVP
jgi:GNAT superfamily N-acetyltransferase